MRWRRRLRRPWVLEGVTLNDDFTDRRTDVPATLRSREPAWIGVQEGKRREYEAELPNRYGVCQRMTSAATAGVAVIWDRRQFTAIGAHANKDNPRKLGYGYAVLVGQGNGILARGVAWVDVRVGRKGSRRQVRLASVHRLPHRDRARWTLFDHMLDRWIRQSPIPVWLAGDFNTKDARALSRRLTGRVRLSHVDGHLITGSLRFRSPLRALKRRTSDHRAVAALVKIPKRKRKP